MDCEKLCGVCGVTICTQNGVPVVVFSHGKPGTLDRLAARVCQFLPSEKRPQCINQNYDLSKIPRHEFYD